MLFPKNISELSECLGISLWFFFPKMEGNDIYAVLLAEEDLLSTNLYICKLSMLTVVKCSIDNLYSQEKALLCGIWARRESFVDEIDIFSLSKEFVW